MNKVCIIGCGMIAQNAHIPAYKSMDYMVATMISVRLP